MGKRKKSAGRGAVWPHIVLPCDQIRVSAGHKHLVIRQQCAEGGAVLNNAHQRYTGLHLRQHTSVLMRVSLAGRFSCVFQSDLHKHTHKGKMAVYEYMSREIHVPLRIFSAAVSRRHDTQQHSARMTHTTTREERTHAAGRPATWFGLSTAVVAISWTLRLLLELSFSLSLQSAGSMGARIAGHVFQCCTSSVKSAAGMLLDRGEQRRVVGLFSVL